MHRLHAKLSATPANPDRPPARPPTRPSNPPVSGERGAVLQFLDWAVNRTAAACHRGDNAMFSSDGTVPLDTAATRVEQPLSEIGLP